MLDASYGHGNDIPFPNFASAQLDRIQTNGTRSELKVNIEQMLKTQTDAKDIPLEWGDILEIQQLDHKINESWQGLSQEQAQTLTKSLSRVVRLINKSQSTNVVLVPHITFSFNKITDKQKWEDMMTSLKAQGPLQSSFWLSSLANDQRFLLASSDLTRIKVTRTDENGKEIKWTLNVLDGHDQNDLWLRDGDVIQVPERDPNSPAPNRNQPRGLMIPAPAAPRSLPRN